MIDRIGQALSQGERENTNSDELALYQRGFGRALQGAALILEEEGMADAARFLFRLSRANEGSLGEVRQPGDWKRVIRSARDPGAYPASQLAREAQAAARFARLLTGSPSGTP